MIQAYRRGLLKPDSPFGSRSRLRETILLESIEMEELYQVIGQHMQLTSTILGGANMAVDARKRVMKEYGQDVHYYHLLKHLDFDRAEQYKFNNSALAITAVYEILQQVGVLPE